MMLRHATIAGTMVAPWIVASHRFVEVSLGIAVALLTAEVWRMPGVKAGSS